MPLGTSRRQTWRTSARSRSRVGGGPITNNINDDTTTNHYTKQLNPYKKQPSTSLRGSFNKGNKSKNNTPQRDVVVDEITNGLDLGNDDDVLGDILGGGDDGDEDDILGLDNILSSISDNKKEQHAVSSSISDGAPQSSYGVDKEEKLPNNMGGTSSTSIGLAPTDNNLIPPAPSLSIPIPVQNNNTDIPSQEHNILPPHSSPPPDLDGQSQRRNSEQTTPIQNTTTFTDDEHTNISPVSEGGNDEEDNDTLWTDGDATRQHKLMMQSELDAHRGPTFTSSYGGFENDNNVNNVGGPITSDIMPHMNIGPSFVAANDNIGGGSSSSLLGSSVVDSIIDDISMPGVGGSIIKQQQKQEKQQPPQISHPSTPLRGARIFSVTHNSSSSQRPVGRGSKEEPPSIHNNTANNNNKEAPEGSMIFPAPLSQIERGSSEPDRHSISAASIDDQNMNDPPHQYHNARPSSHHQQQTQQSKFNNDRRNHNSGNNTLPISKISHRLPEDETLSTVTDPTESPFIYTYRRRSADEATGGGGYDDSDTVSQITSSITAGTNSLGGSMNLQNIPNSFGGGRGSLSSTRSNSRGLSWMNNGTATGICVGSSRMIHRKNKSASGASGMAIPGPYGRNSKSGSKTRNINSIVNRGGSGSGSGGSVGSGGSGTRSMPDVLDGDHEIAYTMNAGDHNRRKSRPTAASRRSSARPPMSRMSDDLSTVESEGNYIDTNSNLDVSRLGMGGVSTIGGPSAQSVMTEGNASVISESTQSTMGIFQNVALFMWKTQHHATRYFFPKPPSVTRRKKFDRTDSDDLEELLLEEGSANPNLRSRSGSSGHEDDDIDYFGRAMGGGSPTANNNNNLRKPPQKKKRRGKGGINSTTAKTVVLFFVLTAALTIYRMPNDNNTDERISNEQEFPTHENRYDAYRDRDYSPQLQADENGQVLDYVTNAMVDRDSAVKPHGSIPGPGSSNHVNEYDNVLTAEIDAADSLDAMDKQYLFRDGAAQIPAKFEVLANVDDLLFQRGIDVPFYWHVPRSGGGTMNDLLGR